MSEDFNCSCSRALGRLEGKMDSLIDQLKEHRQEVSEFGDRLAAVESNSDTGKKIAGTLGAVAGGLATIAVAAVEPITKWLSK